jgi:hypothetical protein
MRIEKRMRLREIDDGRFPLMSMISAICLALEGDEDDTFANERKFFRVCLRLQYSCIKIPPAGRKLGDGLAVVGLHHVPPLTIHAPKSLIFAFNFCFIISICSAVAPIPFVMMTAPYCKLLAVAAGCIFDITPYLACNVWTRGWFGMHDNLHLQDAHEEYNVSTRIMESFKLVLVCYSSIPVVKNSIGLMHCQCLLRRPPLEILLHLMSSPNIPSHSFLDHV